MVGSIRKNLKLFIVSGVFSAVMLSLYTPFTVKYLQRLGGDEFYISLLNSLPGLIGIISSLPGAFYMIKRSDRSMKAHTITFLWLSRLTIFLFALIVYVPPQMAPLIFVLVFAVRSLPDAISQTAFQGFTGDLFPEDFRSTAISLRNKLSTPISIAVSLIAGWVLRSLPKSDHDRMFYYQIFFVAAVVFGILEIIAFMPVKEPKKKSSVMTVDAKKILKEVFKQKKFVSFTSSSLLFYFGWQMGWPLFNIYQVVYLGADEFWLSIIQVVSSIGAFLGYSYWNRFIRKRGNAIVASVTTLGMAFNPILFALSPNLYWISALNFIAGFFTAGNVTVLLNGLLESTPVENRVIYIGTYNTLINVSLTVSPIVAHFVLQLTGIYWSLIIVAGVRMLGSLVFYINHANNKKESFG